MKFLFIAILAYVGAVLAEGSVQESLCATPMQPIAQWTDSVPPSKPHVPGLIPLAEVLGQNVGVWAWDRFYLQKHYAEISLSTMRDNMHNGFTWDANHYAINFFGHPYQGTFYYNAGRSAGFGFYPSFVFTTLGSFTWEMYMEREEPSTNDLLVTSLGGATLGEVLYRLSARLVDHPRSNGWRDAGAFVLSPMASANRAMLGKRGNYPGYVPIEMSAFMGGGAHLVSNYSYDNEDVETSKTTWSGKTLGWGMELVYGQAGRRVRAPFDYFTMQYGQLFDSKGTLLDFETMGVLKNFTLAGGKNWIDLSLQLSYDVMYGDLVEMSANSIGPSVEFNIHLNDWVRMRMANRAAWMIIGASDFNYEDVLVAQDSSLEGELRTYQLGTGLTYKNSMEFEWRDRGIFRTHSSLYAMRTMPRSAPHYGATGYDVVAKHDAALEAYLPANWALGYRIDAYWKFAAYRRFAPLARVLGSNWMYVRYNF